MPQHTVKLPGWDEDALLAEVLRRPRRAFLPFPDSRVIERPGWLQIVTPSFRQGNMNGVELSVLDPNEADAVIDATIAEYRRLGIAFRWTVTPDCAPADLAARLGRRGLSASSGVAMARATLDAPELTDPAIHVERVGWSRVEEFTRVSAQGWGLDPAPFATLHRSIVAHPEAGQRLFLAYHDGQPAATAGYVGFARSAYLVGGVVLPAFRGKGLYRALVAARLRDAAAHGLSLATSHAMAQTSAPLLERMGFSSVCQYQVFRG
jgi:ribosomal protein S18 acetylase RimI-like enzyme